MNDPLHRDIVKTLSQHYNRPLLRREYRSDYVAGMILQALGAEWRLCSLDWAWRPWDLERNDGARLLIQQAAALQPWDIEEDTPPPLRPVFPVVPRRGPAPKGYRPGDPEGYPPGRLADVYIFAWHPDTDLDRADQRCPEQWQFFVVPEFRLTEHYPQRKSLPLTPLAKIATAADYAGLAVAVNAALAAVPDLKVSVMTPEDEELCRAVDEIMERVRQGKERIYSSAEVRAYLGLDN